MINVMMMALLLTGLLPVYFYVLIAIKGSEKTGTKSTIVATPRPKDYTKKDQDYIIYIPCFSIFTLFLLMSTMYTSFTGVLMFIILIPLNFILSLFLFMSYHCMIDSLRGFWYYIGTDKFYNPEYTYEEHTANNTATVTSKRTNITYEDTDLNKAIDKFKEAEYNKKNLKALLKK